MHNDGSESSLTDKKHLQRYFQYAETIILSYEGTEPFHNYLKKYFSQHKKHGSRDRKIITSLCYNYFRVCFGVSNKISFKEKLLLSIFLCENKDSPLVKFVKSEWQSAIELPLVDRLNIFGEDFNKERIFPFSQELSIEIDCSKFSFSFLIQPKLFIRIRPGHEKSVLDKLSSANILFAKINADCLAFYNTEKVSNVIDIDREAVIQDYNSQRTVPFFASFIQHNNFQISIWDCCAGSGGKSILAFDIFKNIQLTVSDTRKKILQNLQTRFQKAGIKNFNLSIFNLEKPAPFGSLFDLIIADVPCSGSGTWSRTPEQLSFFKKKEIDNYSSLQKKIIENALPHLKDNAHLLYITCSVFKKENEENVDFFKSAFELKLIGMQYLKGYEMQADTLFVALLKKTG